MKTSILVAITWNNSIEDSWLFVADTCAKAQAEANQKILEICRKEIWNFDEYTSEDIKEILFEQKASWGERAVVAHMIEEIIEVV